MGMRILINPRNCKTKRCTKCKVELSTGVNITEHRFNRKQYACDSCQNRIKRDQTKKRNDESVAGVYGIYFRGELVYVGESQYIQNRLRSHFLIGRKNAEKNTGFNFDYKEEYIPKILLEEEDLRLRLITEIELIAKHKPILNHPYRRKGYIHVVDGEEVLEEKELDI